MRVFIFISIAFILSCTNTTELSEEITIDKKEERESNKKEIKAQRIRNKSIDVINSLECNEYDYWKIKRDKFDLRIDESFDFTKVTDSIIENTKAIIVDFDTLPQNLNVFKNLKRLQILGNCKTSLKNFYFPKLKILITWGTLLEVDSKVLNQLEYIDASKSRIKCTDKGLTLKNIKGLILHHSELNNIDFNMLSNIQLLHLFALKGDTVNFREFNLSNSPCLTQINIIDDYGIIKGAPTGVKERKWKNFYIYNRDLNSIEKQIVDSLNKINFKN